MKTLKLILTTLLTLTAATCAFVLFGCTGTTDSGTTDSDHTHSYSTEWKYNETSHYKVCSCGNKSSYSAHTWNGGETSGDTVTYTCLVCGATKTHTHTWGEGVTVGDTVTYTCTECSGTKSHVHTWSYTSTDGTVDTYTCSGCSATKTAAHAHTWSYTSTDGMVDTYTCTGCSAKDTIAHTHTWDDGVVTTAATCTLAGVKTYTCETCGATKTEAIAALGHDASGAKWQHNLTQHYQLCSRCGSTLNAYDHAYDEVITTAPTCTTPGEKQLTCSVCGYSATAEAEVVSHSYAEEWSKNETTHYKVCKYNCGATSEVAVHTWDEGTVITAATETEEGTTKYVCTVCGYEKTETVPVLSHTHSYSTEWSTDDASHWKECSCGDKSELAVHTWDDGVVTNAATETAEGVKTYTCTICNATRTEAIAVIEHVHTFDTSTWKTDSNGHYHAATCGHTTVYGDYANHTYGSDAVLNDDGTVTLTCTVCGYGKVASENVYDGGDTDEDGNPLYDGYIAGDMYSAFTIGGDDKDYTYVVWNMRGGIYYKIEYYGSGTITLHYIYYYARGTKTDEDTFTLTNGQTYTWYRIDGTDPVLTITTDSEESFCGVLGLVWYGEEDPDPESDFEVGEEKEVTVPSDGLRLEFIAPSDGDYVITCGDDVLIYTDEETDNGTESTGHGSSYTVTLEEGEVLYFELYSDDWTETTTTVLVSKS